MLKRLIRKTLVVMAAVSVLIPFTSYADIPEMTVSAKSAIVMDSATHHIIYGKDEKLPCAMASTTKIMTCLIACESACLNDTVVITQEMLENTEGTSLYLKPNDRISFKDLIKGAMLASGNDAANAIALHIAKSLDEFILLMNEKAKEIGMDNTVFETPSGLDQGNHHSTAYDMALLASYALNNSVFASVCKMVSAEITINQNKQVIYNHNKLLKKDENFIGLKTGFTNKAGRCLVSAYDYRGSIIICVTLDDPNDWEDHINLVDLAKKNYTALNSGDTLFVDIVGSEQSTVKCSYNYTVASVGDISVKVYYYPIVYSPIRAGDKIGEAEIYSGDSVAEVVPLVADENV